MQTNRTPLSLNRKTPALATSENDRLVRATEAARLLSCDKSTLWRWRKMGILPEPVRITPGCVGWRLSTLRRVMDGEEASNTDEGSPPSAA